MSGDLRENLREDLKGEWKLLKVWECHKCKVLVRMGRNISTHKCDIEEDELSISNSAIEELKKVIREQKELIENQKGNIEDRDKLIENQKNAVGSHKSTIKDQNKAIEDQNKAIEDQNKAIDSQKVVIDEQNKLIKEKAEEDQNKIIEDQKRTIEGHRRAIDSQKISIDDRDRIINDQKMVIDSQKRVIIDKDIKDIKENVVNKNTPDIRNEDNGGICVHVLEEGKQIKDSKDVGYRENIEIEIFEKGKGKDRIIIKNGRLTKKPDDIDIIGEYTTEGFVMKGIYKN